MPQNNFSGVQASWIGPFASHSGFSKMNREIVSRLARDGARIRVETTGEKQEVSDQEIAPILAMQDVQVRPDSPRVYGMTMPTSMGGSGPRIIYTMVETSGSIHRDYAEKADLASEVWVPSDYLNRNMKSAGVSTPIMTMPLGVDHEVFRPDAKPIQLPDKLPKFKFLSVFWWGPRKGYDTLIKAFVSEFTAEDDVCLIISTKPHVSSSANSEKMMDEIRKTIDSIARRHARGSLPAIVSHYEHMTESRMAGLYAACDAFVLMSSGEGFGLPYFEAGACGLPVVASRCTAQGEYLDDTCAYMIDPDKYEVSSPFSSGFGQLAKWCRYYEGQNFPVFGQRAIRHVGAAMRQIMSDGRGPGSRAYRLRKKILDGLTWEHAAERVGDRLLEISSQRRTA